MNVVAQPLTSEAFAPFGDVLETKPEKGVPINNGTTMNYSDLSRVTLDPQDQARISFYRSEPRTLPLQLEGFERHPLGSQAFLPATPNRFCVVVTTGDNAPDEAMIKAFVTAPGQGVNLHRNVWHHPLIALDATSDFWVVDRANVADENFVYVPLSAAITLEQI